MATLIYYGHQNCEGPGDLFEGRNIEDLKFGIAWSRAFKCSAKT